MQTASLRPLSPEMLTADIKYTFNVKGFRYVGYFNKLLYCCGRCCCVFTYEPHGKGGVVYADAPAPISDLAFTPKAKSGVYKA